MEKEAYKIMDDREEIHWWYLGGGEILRNVIKKYLKNNMNILDIGCGTGRNLALLQSFGKVKGIEYDESSVIKAQKKFPNIEIKKGELPNKLNLNKDEIFDLITLFDVLEHIEDDRKSLEVLYEYLSENGKLILTVPAFDFLWTKSDEVQFHKRRYRKKELTNLLKNIGYKIEYSSYFNFFLFMPTVMGKILMRFDKYYTVNKEMKMTNKYLNKILYFIFKSESYFIPKLKYPFGISVVIVAKK